MKRYAETKGVSLLDEPGLKSAEAQRESAQGDDGLELC
jgi:hypothetical protein